MTKQKIVALVLSSLITIFNCKGQSKEMNEMNQQLDKSLQDFINRPIYAVLTKSILDTIDDDKLEQTVMDNIFKKLERIKSYEKEYEIIKSLSNGRQAVFATWMLESEVNNGGFNQYFFNFASSGQYAEEARDGFTLINANKHADLTQRAMNMILKNAKKLSKFRDGTLKSFGDSYKNNPLNALDSEFYDLQKIENLYELRTKYIRSHLNEFIDQ